MDTCIAAISIDLITQGIDANNWLFELHLAYNLNSYGNCACKVHYSYDPYVRQTMLNRHMHPALRR